jgi:hypothetical protein
MIETLARTTPPAPAAPTAAAPEPRLTRRPAHGRSARDRQAWPGQVWEVYDGGGMTFRGYLVTARGDVNRLVAWSPMELVYEDAAEEAAERGEMLRAAQQIARDPAYAGRCGLAADLRDYGWQDTPRPLPAEVYGWYCGPVGGGPWKADVRPMPYCRYRFAALLAQHNDLHFSAAERAAYPLHAAGVRAADGSGRDLRVAIPDPVVFQTGHLGRPTRLRGLRTAAVAQEGPARGGRA